VPDLRHIYLITCLSKKEVKMKRLTARKIGLFILAGFMVFFICGCETINAFQSGSVRFQDVKMMSKAENVANSRPLNIASAASEEDPFSCGWQSSKRQSEIFKPVKGTDSWIKNNLW
jgi:hypothetical protein